MLSTTNTASGNEPTISKLISINGCKRTLQKHRALVVVPGRSRSTVHLSFDVGPVCFSYALRVFCVVQVIDASWVGCRPLRFTKNIVYT